MCQLNSHQVKELKKPIADVSSHTRQHTSHHEQWNVVKAIKAIIIILKLR